MDDPVRGAQVGPPPGTTPYADDTRWRGRFGFLSDSNPDREYIISYDTAGGYWVCSCPAGVNRGECKHLKRYRRSPTRADAKRAVEEAERQAKVEADRAARERAMNRPLTAPVTQPTLAWAGMPLEAGDALVIDMDGKVYRVGTGHSGPVVGLAGADVAGNEFVFVVPAGPPVPPVSGVAVPGFTGRDGYVRPAPAPAGAKVGPPVPKGLTEPVRRFRQPGEV